MREFRLHDIALYFVLVAIYMASNYPIDSILRFIAGNLTFGFHLTIDIIVKGYIEPLNMKDKVAQKGTLYQHILSRVFKSFLPGITSFSKANPSYSFVANEVWKRWLDIRSFIQCHNGCEMSRYDELEDGLWISKNFRSHEHDLIVFYVPNFVLFGSQPYVYAEYLTTLHGLLMLQGFDNPAIFVTKFPDSMDRWNYQECLEYVFEVWRARKERNLQAQFILSGDSLGATLVLSMLLNWGIKPLAAILVSPIPIWQSREEDRDLSGAANLDFLTYSIVEKMTNLCQSAESPPPDLDVWKNAMPEGGMVLCWGDSEYNSENIEKLGLQLSQFGRVKFWKGKDRIHCWPLVSFLTEDSQSEKEDACFVTAGIISRIALWNTDPYLGGAREPMNVLTIDDEHA